MPAIPSAPESEKTKTNGKLATIIAWSISAILIVLIVLIIVAGRLRPAEKLQPSPQEPSPVAAITCHYQPFEQALELPARIVADQEAGISAEIGGTLRHWLVDDGAAVQQGQEVARLDTADIEASLAEIRARQDSARAAVELTRKQEQTATLMLAQAKKDATTLDLELRAAQSAFELADKEYRRISALITEQVGAQSDLDRATNARTQAKIGVARVKDSMEKAKIAIKTAAAQLQSAIATRKLNLARIRELDAAIASTTVQLGKRVLHAPLTGRLEKHLVEEGETVQPHQVLAKIYRLNYVRARVDVADRYAPFLDPDAKLVDLFVARTLPGAKRQVKASIVLPLLPRLTGDTSDGPTLTAQLVYLARAADPLSNTFQVELRLKNPDQALRPGMVCRARIVYLLYPKALLVPLRAILVTDEGPRVLVVEQRKGQTFAAVRDIEAIAIYKKQVLTAGKTLHPGDRVITDGTKGLVDGERVRLLQLDGKTPAPAIPLNGKSPAH